MKRILSFILTIGLLTSLCYTSYARTSGTSNTDEVVFKYNALQELGILPETEHENYGILRDTSKADFLVFVCNIYRDYGFGEDDSTEAIAVAENLGLIHKGQDDLYKPISYDEAMTILVRFLSYGVHAEESGGFPYGYIRIAKSIGLADNLSVSSGQNLKEHDVVNLLYNAINAPYAEIDYITDDGVVYKNKSDKAVLHELRGIYRIDGIVEATGTAFLRPDETVSEGQIRIGGYTYYVEDDFGDYLGMHVMAYVNERASVGDMVLFAVSDRNDEVTVYPESLIGPSGDFRTVEYYSANNRVSKLTIDQTAAVIYNGQPLETYTKEAFTPTDGYIRFINNDGKIGYDTIFITSYKTIVADSVSKLNKSVANIYTYDAENISLSLEANNEDVIRIFDETGETDVTAIAEDDVIRVAKSVLDGRTVVTVYVSREKIAGKVSAMNKGDNIEITVDGIEYVLSEAYETALEKADSKAIKLKVGGSYTFYLDDAGKIAFAKNTEGISQYGVVYAIASGGVWTPEYTLKIFTSEGEWKEFKVAEKIEFDGVSGTLPENIIGQIKCGKDGKVGVIGYMINSDGEISMIDMPEVYDNGNNGKFNIIENFTDNYRSNNSSFDSEIFIKDKHTMWFINTDNPGDENSYSLGAKSVLQGDESCTLNAYNINEGMFAELFIVERNSSATTLSVQIGDLLVVEEISQVMNSEGELTNMITGKIGTYDKFSYYCKDESIVGGLAKGDIISFHTDSTGSIDKIEKYRSFAAGEVYSNPSAMHAVAAVPQGKVVDHDPVEKWIKIDCGGDKPRIVRTANVTSVIIYDLETDELYNGSLSDIEKGALITTKLKWSRATTVVVYQ